jgi:hypothetical protein
MAEKFEGVVVKDDMIRHGRESLPLAGAHVTVDAAGEIDKRITATRLVLTGPFALAFRKKKDRRELYLMVEGEGGAFVVEVDPKKGGDARRFAARVNTMAAAAVSRRATMQASTAAASPTAPPQWMADPTGRHESRYWNGSAWSDHVADAGVQASDPV